MPGLRRAVLAVGAASQFLQPGAAAPAATACTPAPSGQTYDYVVVGSGAGGIPVADRLSEAGHSVLLIEKGPPSIGLWGGTMKPKWLEGTNLTRFDVPGLFNQIWHDSVGVACTDINQMAGCVLGGGVAVNSGLWWKPHPRDWDFNFPEGWKNSDMAKATAKVFSRIPGTTVPSTDGKLYEQEGFEMLGGGLKQAGWKEVIPNDHSDEKNHTFGHSTFMITGGQRGGPLTTYLATASQRKNFALWTNTIAAKLVREGGHVTGIQLECNGDGGHSGLVSLTPSTGRVVLSAGSFGSAKLLFRSGIGPADQLNIVKNSTDGPTMIGSESWINLPVGYNLNDHVGTDIEISHPSVVTYDFYGAWDKVIATDEEKYLKNRTGILTQSAPNLGPIFWETLKGTDGIDKQLQWQARVEGKTDTSMTVTQYLGTGTTSRGRMVITRQLNTLVSIPPYLREKADRDAVIQGIENIRQNLKGVANLTWITPTENITSEAFVDSIPATPARRCANHWIGTAKMGLDDGRNKDGTAVVDTNTKVYGMDNVFVVDASIFPGHITGNPSAMIVIAAEHAADKILALPTSTAKPAMLARALKTLSSYF